jgi:hypothetical protein
MLIKVLAAAGLVMATSGGREVTGQMMQPQLPRAGISGVLRDGPIVATFEVVGAKPDQAGPWISAIYRDRAGSVRTELTVGANKFVSIVDVPRARMVILDQHAQTAVVAKYDSTGSRPMWGFNLKPTYTDDRKQILNINCRRVLLFQGASGAPEGEVWIAEDLGLPVEDREPRGGKEIIWRATSIEAQPPRAELFSIPETFKVVGQ